MIYKKGVLPNLYTTKGVRKLDDDFLRYLNEQNENLDGILNSGISFSENMDGVFITFTSNAVANTEDTIAHTLGKVPTGYIVTDIDKAAVVYRTSAATAANILLKCNVASTTVTIFVF